MTPSCRNSRASARTPSASAGSVVIVWGIRRSPTSASSRARRSIRGRSAALVENYRLAVEDDRMARKTPHVRRYLFEPLGHLVEVPGVDGDPIPLAVDLDTNPIQLPFHRHLVVDAFQRLDDRFGRLGQ